MSSQHLAGIRSTFVDSARLKQHVLACGSEDGPVVAFIHGNFSSSTYYEELMVAMPPRFRCLAVDLRGYGDTEPRVIDATRGARDWSDDLAELMATLHIERAHWVGWSAGAAPIMQLNLDHPTLVASLTLVAPVSPFGYGGTRDAEGRLCHPDAAGSGGGVVDADFVRHVMTADKTRQFPHSPLNVIYQTFFHEVAHLPRESALLDGSLKQQTGTRHYPGDSVASPNWPHVAPGNFGPMNAISAKHYSLGSFAESVCKPDVLWIYGDKDQIISNRSLSDLAVLGEIGLIAGWPGASTYPPQPMVDQMRYVLEQYRQNGGRYREVVMKNTGHSPFLERPDEFLGYLVPHLDECTR